MTNVFQTNDSDIFARHRANIIDSLTRRLNVARAAQDTQLVALLEQEQQQLGLKTAAARNLSSASRLKNGWHHWLNAIANRSKLSVEQMHDASGASWWHAHDPKTGMTLYAESESEIINWIEENQLGR